MKRTPSDQRAFKLLALICATQQGRERLVAQLTGWLWHRPDGCVEYWTKTGRDTHGKSYPRVRLRHDGQTDRVYAHRLFWMLRERRPVPPGHEIGHTCHNHRCIIHTESMSKAHNAADANHRRRGCRSG